MAFEQKYKIFIQALCENDMTFISSKLQESASDKGGNTTSRLNSANNLTGGS